MTDWTNFIHLQLALLDLPCIPEGGLYPNPSSKYDPQALTLRDRIGQLFEDGLEIEKVALDIIEFSPPAGAPDLFPSLAEYNSKHPWKVRLSMALSQSSGPYERRMTIRTVIKSGVVAKTKEEAIQLVYDLALKKMYEHTHAEDDGWTFDGLASLEILGRRGDL